MDISLNKGWELVEAPITWGEDRLAQALGRREKALPCDLPCDVRMPLVAAGVIGDPVEADNYRRSMWVEQRSWWFIKEFDWQGGEYAAAELKLDRLDYGATVFLNGSSLGRHMSVHYPFVKDVKGLLRPGRNTLAVRLTCGLEEVTDLDVAGVDGAVFTEAGNGCPERGDKRRPFLHKPQYVFGWDWGPRVATCGIGSAQIAACRGVAIRSVMFSTKSIEGGTAKVCVNVKLDSLLPASTQDADVELSLSIGGRAAANAARRDVLLLSGMNFVDFALDVPEVLLWWPNGYGGQPLYDLEVKVSALGEGDRHCSKVGIRTLELDTSRLDAASRRFAFVVNGATVQCKGGDWIPSDSIYARVTDEKYERLISEAREANFTMLRVWGGGLYEKDIFYDLCDRCGILVWQDFMFACAAIPDYLESFRREVYSELDWQTLRLGSRACLALFCGNNENHWLLHADRPELPGLYVYNQMAPEAVRRNCPHVPWWPSSPYGGAFPNDSEIGDRHHWNDCMMNPDMEKRIAPEEFDKVTSKFVSEYGYPGPCRGKSIERYFGRNPVERESEIWSLHNNTFEKRTVAEGIRKHYADPEKLSPEEYLLYAPLVQALMLGYSLESIRSVPECWGELFWMYNDCWGETGWTIVDYYGRRKLSYYAVKRALAPVKLVMRERDGQAYVTAHNETGSSVKLDVEYGYASFDGSVRDTRTKAITLPARSKGEVLSFPIGEQDGRSGVWFARAENLDAAILRRLPFRKLDVGPAGLQVSDIVTDGNDLLFRVTAGGYAHAVHFGFGDDSRLSDEYFDLLPGETRLVRAFGEAGKDIEARSIRAV